MDTAKKGFGLVEAGICLCCFLAGCATTYFYTSSTSAFLNWDDTVCKEITNNSRDGFRIGDDRGPIPGEKPTVSELMTNYYNDYSHAATVSTTAGETVTSTSADATTEFTKGGNLSRCLLLNVLKSLEEGDTYVEYAFGRFENKNVIIIQGGRINPITNERMDAKLTFRTGTDADCYCPTRCGIE